jgi:hypothetical protein
VNCRSLATLGMTLSLALPIELRRWRGPWMNLCQRVGVVDATVLHHESQRLRVTDRLERVAIQYHEVGKLPGLDRAEVATEPDGFSAPDRRRAQRIERRHPA